MTERALWLNLCWLTSPALPVGSFAFSQGLEQLFERGSLKNGSDILHYLRFYLQTGLGYWELPLLKRMYQACQDEQWEQLKNLNSRLLSGRETAELLLEEQAQGQALMQLCGKLFTLPPSLQACKLGYVAAFALFAWYSTPVEAKDKLTALELMQAYAFAQVQNALAASCKALPLGQVAAAQVQAQLLPVIEEVCKRALTLDDGDLGTSLPFLAIVSSLHESQYSRLFRS